MSEKGSCLSSHRASYGSLHFRLPMIMTINQQDAQGDTQNVSTKSDGRFRRFGLMSEPEAQAEQHCVAGHICVQDVGGNVADGVHASGGPRKQEHQRAVLSYHVSQTCAHGELPVIANITAASREGIND